MRFPATVFAVLLVLIQYPLWFGHGGVLRLHQLEHQVSDQKSKNTLQMQRNAALEAEVRDLGKLSDAVEERARVDLGMVREGEHWFRYPALGNQDGAAPSQAK